MSRLNWQSFEETAIEKGLKIFSPRDVSLFFDVNPRAVRGFLSYNTKKGLVIKLKQGFYALKKSLPSDFLIANKVYEPSYISLSAALSFYGLIPETIYSITSVTPKPTRDFEIMGRTFSYNKIKKQAFTGYEPCEVSGETILIATPEKAVIDFLYFVCLGKRSNNSRLKISKVSKQGLWDMAKLFENLQFSKFLKKVLQGKYD